MRVGSVRGKAVLCNPVRVGQGGLEAPASVGGQITFEPACTERVLEPQAEQKVFRLFQSMKLRAWE